MSDTHHRTGLGSTLAEAEASGFFQWFHLTLVDQARIGGDGATDPAGHERQRFRPSGARFHHLVELELMLDGMRRIGAARLQIDRAFIANAAIRPFARDIAKSFLQWVLPPDARSGLEPDIEAIGRFCDGESRIIVAAPQRSWPDRWFKRRRSLAAAFMAVALRAERRIGRTRIILENDGNRWLQMGVATQ